MTDNRGFVIRRLTGGQSLGVSGYGLEVVSVVAQEHNAKIFFGIETQGTDASFADDAFIRAIPGQRILARFDYLRVEAATAGASVVVKVLTSPKTAWFDVDPGGKPRTKFVARNAFGSTLALPTLATLTAQSIFNSGLIIPENDRYWTDEQFEQMVWWYGSITGDAAFTVWIFQRLDPNNVNSPFKAVQNLASRPVNPSAAALTASGGVATNAVDFHAGTSATTTNNNAPMSFPVGEVQVVIDNQTAGTLTYEYMIGCKAHN